MLFDTHCHLNFKAYRDDAELVIERARAEGVMMNVVGSQYETSKRAVAIAQKYENIYATIGLHPIHLVEEEIDEEEDHFITSAEKFDPELYRALAKSSSKAVGIGECGLDYYHLPEKAIVGEVELDQTGIRDLQKKAFIEQIKLAHELNLALVVHTRQGERTRDSESTTGPNAYTDVLEILRSNSLLTTHYSLRTIIHCFSGTLDHAREFLNIGCVLAFGGIVTFKNAKELREVVKETPIERIVLETDAPYLAPEPYRGKRNEPLYVKEVARVVAEVKGLSIEEVARQTMQNARAVFNIF